MSPYTINTLIDRLIFTNFSSSLSSEYGSSPVYVSRHTYRLYSSRCCLCNGTHSHSPLHNYRHLSSYPFYRQRTQVLCSPLYRLGQWCLQLLLRPHLWALGSQTKIGNFSRKSFIKEKQYILDLVRMGSILVNVIQLTTSHPDAQMVERNYGGS